MSMGSGHHRQEWSPCQRAWWTRSVLCFLVCVCVWSSKTPYWARSSFAWYGICQHCNLRLIRKRFLSFLNHLPSDISLKQNKWTWTETHKAFKGILSAWMKRYRNSTGRQDWLSELPWVGSTERDAFGFRHRPEWFRGGTKGLQNGLGSHGAWLNHS